MHRSAFRQEAERGFKELPAARRRPVLLVAMPACGSGDRQTTGEAAEQ
jgi:hypothetical protein